MKMPERWRALPRCALLVSILAQKSRMMSWHHAVTWRDVIFYVIICHDKMNLYRSTHQKLQNHVFQHGDLDLWPWPSNSSEILSESTPIPNFGSVRQTVQPRESWQTHTQTGPILYPRPLTREGTMLVSSYLAQHWCNLRLPMEILDTVLNH